MNIIWDNKKNEWLMLNRDLSFEEISEKILNDDYLDIIENPVRGDQFYFIMDIEKHIWVIPFLIDEEENIILKTAFPSRKYQKKYGGKYEG
jgi:uncharacterized DUF497 family protein